MNDIRFNISPSKQPEFVKVNNDNMIIDTQALSEDDCCNIIVSLIEYLNNRNIDTLTNANDGTRYEFITVKNMHKEMTQNDKG